MKLAILFIFYFICFGLFSQAPKLTDLNRTVRFSVLNPALEIEYPTFGMSSIVLKPGLGINYAYAKLSRKEKSNVLIHLSPFVDISYRMYYNRYRRQQKKRFLNNNSGNFLSANILYRSPEIYSSYERTSKNDLLFSLCWGGTRFPPNGIKHSYRLGSGIYTDLNGVKGFVPVFVNLSFFI